MKKEEFIKLLKSKLNKFAATDVNDVCSYYEELISDRMENEKLSEEEVIASLGSIDRIVRNISVEMIASKKHNGKQIGKNTLVVLGCLFASPLLLPLAIIVFVLYVVIFSLWISLSIGFGVGALGALVGGIVCLAISGYPLLVNISIFGGGLIACALLGMLSICIAKVGWKLLSSLTVSLARFITRKEK